MDSHTFWSAVCKKATEIGFSDISSVRIQDISKESEFLDRWIEEGNAAQMEYMKKTKEVRKHPELFLENVRSILVCIVNYYRGQHEGEAKIARYAAGKDYHKVIKKMLQELQTFLQEKVFPDSQNSEYRISLDAHPVMERTWAEKSKLGFLGKNSCLITEKSGSWVLIGAIFTTQNVPEKPEKEGMQFYNLNCGTCTRCIDACPTKAIVQPGKVDARKCISYLTIENKEGIPEEFRDKIGNRLFGCDICQEVCPFNIPRQKEEANPLLETEITGTELLISEILQIKTDEEFLERFAGSSVMRAKRRGLVRNACVVAGNSGNKKLLPLLQNIIDHEEDEMLREHAEWGIQQLEKI